MNQPVAYDTAFNDLLAQKLRTLSRFVQQLEESIAVRHVLYRQLREWIETQHAATKQELLLLDSWQYPANPTVEQRRAGLERSLETLLAEARMESTACWRDTEQLQKELRLWKKQHEDLAQRVRLLSGATQ